MVQGDGGRMSQGEESYNWSPDHIEDQSSQIGTPECLVIYFELYAK